MRTLITLDRGQPTPTPFLNADTADAPAAGVELRDPSDQAVVLRIRSTDPHVLGDWARALHDAADRLAAEQINRTTRARDQRARQTADAVVDAIAPARRGPGLLRRIVQLAPAPLATDANLIGPRQW